MIGSLLYLTMTRPDIQFVVCLCACFQASRCYSHGQAAQWIFRYLKYTLEFGIWYFASSSLDLVGFSDVDFAGCKIDRKSTSGRFHFLGSSRLLVFLQTNFSCTINRKDQVCSCCQLLLPNSLDTAYHKRLQSDHKSVSLMCDSSSVIYLVQNQFFMGERNTYK
jgi:hypothetical protein